MATDVGTRLAALKRETGWTWGKLAEQIGASSGDYVRKVASGAKPGRNLERAVTEMFTVGEVSAPVPRRRDAAGNIARVRTRQQQGMGRGASRRPSDTALPAPRERARAFRDSRGRLGWQQSFAGDDAGTFDKALKSAGQGRRRVKLRAKINGRWVTIGEKGGYTPRDLRAAIRERGGLEAYVEHVTEGRGYAGSGAVQEIEVTAV